MAAAVWLGVSAPTLVSAPLIGADTKASALAGLVVAAGAGLLPDLDHPQATVSRCLPPLSNAAARGISKISGGHRKGTHCLITTGVLTLLVFLVNPANWMSDMGGGFNVGAGLFVFFLGAIASQALHLQLGKLGSWPSAIVLATAAGFLVPAGGFWLPAAFSIGYTVHLLGDFLTVQGIPLLYPFTKKTWRLALLNTAGSKRENLLVFLLTGYCVIVMILLVASSIPWV